MSVLDSRGRACAPRRARIACEANVRSACTLRPVLASALRLIPPLVGALLILLGLLAPDLASALGTKPDLQPAPQVAVQEHEYDGGACGEDDEESFEELIDCGANLDAHLDEPWAIALLRTHEVRMTSQQCEELLADIWSQQRCSAGGSECGKLLAGSVQPTGLEIVSSSATGHVGLGSHDLDGASARRLARPADQRMPKLRDLLPPVPPPKLVTL